MIGLLFIAAVAVWIWCCWRIARAVTTRAASRSRRVAAGIAFAVLLPLPVLDELVGAVQLFPYCHAGEKLTVDPAKIRGQLVRVRIGPPQPVPGMAIPVFSNRFSYASATTGEELASAYRYTAYGGFLVRLLTNDSSQPPILPVAGGGSTCSAPTVSDMTHRYGFTDVGNRGEKR
jgi:hypothetical protein